MDPAEVPDQSEPLRDAARDHQPAFRPGRARCVDRAATLRSSSKDTSCGERATAPKFALSVERRREGGELGHLAACASLGLSPMKPGCLHLREKLRLVFVVVVVASVRCSASGHKGAGVGSFHVAISWQIVATWLDQGQRTQGRSVARKMFSFSP